MSSLFLYPNHLSHSFPCMCLSPPSPFHHKWDLELFMYMYFVKNVDPCNFILSSLHLFLKCRRSQTLRVGWKSPIKELSPFTGSFAHNMKSLVETGGKVGVTFGKIPQEKSGLQAQN